MESQVFKCTLPTDKLAAQKKIDILTYTILFPAGWIFFIAFEIKNLYGSWNLMVPFLIILILLSFFLLKVLICLHGRNMCKYDNMEYKEFSWDAATNEFMYKDKNRTLRFTGDKVRKWVVLSDKKPVDIMLLDNGEQIVLEQEFNPDIHPFLEENKAMLHIPNWSALTTKQIFFLNYYKDSI